MKSIPIDIGQTPMGGPEIDTNVTDISAIGRLNIVCGEDIYEIFDIKSETELIMYYDGFNFFLQHIST